MKRKYDGVKRKAGSTKRAGGAKRSKYRRNGIVNYQPMYRSLAPKQLKVKLRYAAVLDLNPSTGSTVVYKFRANGMYDPNAEVGGHQPLGFDQYMALFDHFTVIGSKITLVASVGTVSTGITIPSLIGINKNDDVNLVDSTPVALLETPSTVWDVLSTGEGSNTQTTLQMTYSAVKDQGVVNPLDNENLRGSASADPTEQTYYHIFYQSVNDTGDMPALTALCTIDYYAILTEPKDLAMS